MVRLQYTACKSTQCQKEANCVEEQVWRSLGEWFESRNGNRQQEWVQGQLGSRRGSKNRFRDNQQLDWYIFVKKPQPGKQSDIFIGLLVKLPPLYTSITTQM